MDFEGLAIATDEELKRLGDKWFTVLDGLDMSDEQLCFRTGLLRLAYSYARMNVLSFGFQYAFGKESRGLGQDLDLLHRVSISSRMRANILPDFLP